MNKSQGIHNFSIVNKMERELVVFLIEAALSTKFVIFMNRLNLETDTEEVPKKGDASTPRRLFSSFSQCDFNDNFLPACSNHSWAQGLLSPGFYDYFGV